MKVEQSDIQWLVGERLITVRKHPLADLFIANYTPAVQFDKLWDKHPLLPSCRGLIFDRFGEVLARPFVKFFNYGEYTGPIPDSTPIVTEKLDGSLGILYWHEDKPHISTRGSFESEQAIEGTNILHEKYAHLFDKFERGYTYLFEILYQENRIVVDYGALRDLVLLTVIDNETGEDVPFTLVRGMFSEFRQPAIHDGTLDELKATVRDNFEGFVVHWPDTGLRLKVKLDEYLRLHKVLTGVTAKTIWQGLKNGDNLQLCMNNVPDEFSTFIRETQTKLQADFDRKAGAALRIFDSILASFTGFAYPDRKQFAMKATKFACRDILFLMYDERDWSGRIWKRIEPTGDSPTFKKEM
jgi:RNA ligase